jgi:hypothetical protein
MISLGARLLRLFEDPLAVDLIEHGAVRAWFVADYLARDSRPSDPWFGVRGYAARQPAKCQPGHTRRRMPSGRTYCVQCQRERDQRRSRDLAADAARMRARRARGAA